MVIVNNCSNYKVNRIHEHLQGYNRRSKPFTAMRKSESKNESLQKGTRANQWHFRSRNRPAINYMFWRSKYNPILENNSIPHNYNSRVILFWELFVLMYLLTRWKTVPCIFLSFVQMRCHLIKWHAKIGGLLPYVFVKLWETVPKKPSNVYLSVILTLGKTNGYWRCSHLTNSLSQYLQVSCLVFGVISIDQCVLFLQLSCHLSMWQGN